MARSFITSPHLVITAVPWRSFLTGKWNSNYVSKSTPNGHFLGAASLEHPLRD
jgi:hypothetical protein